MKNHNIDTALLLIRVGLALVFIVHGWEKITNMESTVSFFESLNLPSFVAYLVSYIELLGGVSMLIGLFTGWSGILLAVVMVGAISLVKLKSGFSGGYEFDLVLFLSAIAISFSGPGKYTVLNFIKKESQLNSEKSIQ